MLQKHTSSHTIEARVVNIVDMSDFYCFPIEKFARDWHSEAAAAETGIQ